MTPKERRLKLSRLQAEVDAADWQVHAVTGRTDHSAADIAALHPDHPDVIKWETAVTARDLVKKEMGA